LPSEQHVLTFIGNTIDWYRQLPTSQRIGSEPADLLFLENNRPTAMEIVRLSFRFGKAVAAIESPQSTPLHPESRPATPADRELPYLLSVNSKLGASAQRSGDQLKSLTQARLTARGADLKNLDAEIAKMCIRIQVLNTISANYQNIAEFVRTASADSDPDVSLAALVENLERTVPEVSADAGAPRLSIPADPPRAPNGIMGRISRVLALSHKEHYIETAIERTNTLIRALQNLRSPFREPFLRQLATFSPDEQNLIVLQQQQSVLAGLVAQLQTVSPAVAALIKQETLLNLYRVHLAEWRSDVQMEYRAAWKALIIRLGGLAITIAALFGINVVMRWVLSAHAQDPETRRALLVGERLLLWVLVIAIVLFAFAFDPSSLATFFGLLSAGLAVGLRDVLLAIGGRILLARRFHIRPGERIEIAGVKGEVTKLGLMEFALNETDAAGRATGREVFIANSYVFVSPATPLFRQISAPA
jgi:Mechanosensitive ion channel